MNNGTGSGLSLNIGENFWFANFRGALRNAGDTETPAGTLNNSRFRDKSIGGTLGFLVEENQQINLDYQHFYAKDVGLPGSALFPSRAVVQYAVEERRLFSLDYTYRNISNIFSKLSVKFFNQFIKRDVENACKYLLMKFHQVEQLPPKSKCSLYKSRSGSFNKRVPFKDRLAY